MNFLGNFCPLKRFKTPKYVPSKLQRFWENKSFDIYELDVLSKTKNKSVK